MAGDAVRHSISSITPHNDHPRRGFRAEVIPKSFRIQRSSNRNAQISLKSILIYGNQVHFSSVYFKYEFRIEIERAKKYLRLFFFRE